MLASKALRIAAGLWTIAVISPLARDASAQATPSEQQKVQWQGDQVSDVFRVEAMFDMLAQPETAQPKQAAGSFQDSWFSNRGLDPRGTAARELREAALTVGLLPAIPREVIEEYARRKDDNGLRTYLEAQRAARLETMGQLFGAWLRKREAEGYAVAPLVDRLLSDSTVLGSDEGNPSLMKQTARTEDAFRRGMRRELAELPPQFEPRRERQ